MKWDLNSIRECLVPLIMLGTLLHQWTVYIYFYSSFHMPFSENPLVFFIPVIFLSSTLLSFLPPQFILSYYIVTFCFLDLFFCLYVCLCGGARSFGPGVTDSCVLSCGCWESNTDPLEEQPMLLTTETSLQPLIMAFKPFIPVHSAFLPLEDPPLQVSMWVSLTADRPPMEARK